jgi:hypothetical protein
MGNSSLRPRTKIWDNKYFTETAEPGRASWVRADEQIPPPIFLSVAAAVALAAVSMAPPSYAQRADAGDWIETWTASPQPGGFALEISFLMLAQTSVFLACPPH